MIPVSSLLRGRTPEPAPRAPVLLVTSPSAFLLDERVFLSLGILKVGAVLERGGHQVEHVDLSGIENFEDVAEIAFSETAAEVFAFTATTPQLPAVARVAHVARRTRPMARLVCGGPHVTLVWSAVKLERKAGRIGRAHRALAQLEGLFDVLVAGDGEEAVFVALGAAPPKLIDADDPKSGMFMTHAVYEESPWPARHLVDVSSYHYTIEGHPAGHLIGQLGCPFACSFCAGRNSNFLRRIRTRSTASVLAEVEHLHKTYGFTGINFFDDELNVNREMVGLMNGIADLQARLGVEFRLRGFVKAELLTAEQAAAMRRAGFRWILCGFEAADERILVNINKKATRADNNRVMEIATRHDLKVKALMSVGHAGETAATIEAVREWLLEVRPADFDCTIITPYPGSPYYDEAVPHDTRPDVWAYTAKKTGDHLYAFDVDYMATADYYKGTPDGGYKSFVFTDHLSPEEIVRLRDRVENDVREKLGIPFNPSAVAVRYEHSMGQGPLPGSVLRKSHV